jgi:hypothetical protein
MAFEDMSVKKRSLFRSQGFQNRHEPRTGFVVRVCSRAPAAFTLFRPGKGTLLLFPAAGRSQEVERGIAGDPGFSRACVLGASERNRGSPHPDPGVLSDIFRVELGELQAVAGDFEESLELVNPGADFIRDPRSAIRDPRSAIRDPVQPS